MRPKPTTFVLCGCLTVLVAASTNAQVDVGSTAFEDAERLPTKTVEIQNKLDEDISVCVAWEDAEENCWMTRGFYAIKPGKSRRITLVTTNKKIYLHARSDSGKTWHSGTSATLSISGGKAFTIRLADSRFPSFAGKSAKLNYDSDAEMKRVEFFSILVSGDEKIVPLGHSSEEDE